MAKKKNYKSDALSREMDAFDLDSLGGSQEIQEDDKIEKKSDALKGIPSKYHKFIRKEK